MIQPDPEVLEGEPREGMGMLDMSRCALFVYVDKDGVATANSLIDKAEAAAVLRQLADRWDPQ